MEEWEAFFEFLINQQPPLPPSECTADDAIEFLLTLPYDGVYKVADRLSAVNLHENPFRSPMVTTYLRLMKGDDDLKLTIGDDVWEEYKSDNTGQDDKVDMFEKCLTTSDVGSSNRLVVTPKEDAQTYFILATISGHSESYLRLEDEEGKPWLFGLSHLKGGRGSFVLTKCWRSYVKEKQLDAGDFVFFQRHLTYRRRLFIGCRRREGRDDATLNSTSPDTSARALEFRDKLKELETHFQTQLSERNSITGSDPVFVIYCGDNQDSEEIYFISYIFNELRLHGFIPLRYDLTGSLVAGNPEMLYESRVCIIIFSINYAHSRECMDEFVEIMGHLNTKNVMIIPVFFKVSFSEVRGQSGSFEEAFTRLGNSVQAAQVLKWRGALLQFSSINKYKYTKGDEVILAKNIIGDVCLMVKYEMYRKRQGMRSQMNSILSLLNFFQSPAPHIVGLWGMAGIGKTTVMGDIVRTQAEKYDVCYFQPDFQLMCQTKGLSQLREEFFSKIFGEENVFKDACYTKLNFTRGRFLDKRVLIVLDGVSSARDAEAFVGGFGWFSGGHTIIFTSRNRQVLVQCNAKEIYEIQKLSKDESIRLCCQYDAKQDSKGKMSELVKYASGIPLALSALASSVKDQNIKDEQNHLRRLRQHPPVKIQDAFKISFDGRDDNEKNIFLDLACFFRGEYKERVVDILDGCGFFTDLGIYGLIDESLISLVDNRIEIPNIFQDTGRFFVSQENKEAGKRSRLWDPDDIADVLIKNSGTEAIEGIFLDLSGLTFALSPTAFEKMHRLRLLKLYSPTSKDHCNVCLPQGLYSLPDELRLLHWERYPLGSLPRNFNPKNLVELNMPYSNLTKLWKGTKNLEKLKRINLSHSRQLTKFPRLSKAKNLEHIDLEGCTSLVKVNSSILHHHKLTFLSVKDCSHLKIMPTTVHLESLEVLNLSGGSELEDIQDFSPNLKEVYLAGTAVREMPSSLGDLTRLVTLDLENCERLQHLPPGISNLKAMVTLKLSGCSNLKSFPILDGLCLSDPERVNAKITMEESVPFKHHSGIQESRLIGAGILQNFEVKLDIHGVCFGRDAADRFIPGFKYLSTDRIPQKSWPRVIISPLPSLVLHSLTSRLYALVSLFLYNMYLVDIPDDLCWLASVQTLDLGGNSFSQIPESIKELRKLHSLGLRHCKNLRSIPELPRSLEIFNAHGCVSLESLPSGLEQLPRHSTFSNCFSLSPEVVREFIRKVLYSVEGMAEGHQLEHSNPLSFSICIPASAIRKSFVNLHAGSSVLIGLTSGMLMTVSGVALSVVVEFSDSYSKAAGFGIKCIWTKTGTDLSPRQERIFQFWAPKEATAVQKDHIFVFGCANLITAAEGFDHDFLGGRVTFEFHPVDWENNPLDDRCTVKKCGVHFISAATTSLSTKRPASMDSGEPYITAHMAPPSKISRLNTVIESVIPSLRKRKREVGFSTPRSLAERARRERISKIFKKLQELVPNMDKQTSDADVLDLVAHYIKDLDSQYKNLKEKRAYCTCINKEKKSKLEARECVQSTKERREVKKDKKETLCSSPATSANMPEM